MSLARVVSQTFFTESSSFPLLFPLSDSFDKVPWYTPQCFRNNKKAKRVISNPTFDIQMSFSWYFSFGIGAEQWHQYSNTTSGVKYKCKRRPNWWQLFHMLHHNSLNPKSLIRSLLLWRVSWLMPPPLLSFGRVWWIYSLKSDDESPHRFSKDLFLDLDSYPL